MIQCLIERLLYNYVKAYIHNIAKNLVQLGFLMPAAGIRGRRQQQPTANSVTTLISKEPEHWWHG